MQHEWLLHDSHAYQFRSPFGAVSCRSAVVLTLAANQQWQPDKVMLCMWQPNEGKSYIELAYRGKKNGYCNYRTTITAPGQPGWLWYYFVVEKDGHVWYYGNNTGLGGMGAVSSTEPAPWQITVYQHGVTTPAWFKDTIMYQIFVDRFYNGNVDGRVHNAPPGSVIHAHWDNNPVYIRDMKNGHILSYDFFGGNLAGVIAKLPYLQEMGVGVIYFNPIFTAPSNHKYDTGDYKTIDPIFGNNELFQELCAKAAARGIAVILDGVFSHTGSDSIYFNREGTYPTDGAYQSKSSPYYSWYRFQHWPDQYESWWGIVTLPNVEELDPSYQEFIIDGDNSVVKHWASLGAKGWRLDVADELPDAFIQKLRQTLKSQDQDSVLIGEVWEDASRKESYGILRPYFQGGELDSVMNYPFRQLVLDFLLGHKSADHINRALLSLKENYPEHNFYACMNILGTHDVPRILTLLGDEEYSSDLSAGQLASKKLNAAQRAKAVARLKAAALWQLTFPGVPCIYYGDEAGVEGYADPLNRRTYPWGKENKELLVWYKQLTALRNEYAVLRTGEWQPIAAGDDILAYERFITGGYDVFGQERDDNYALILINRASEAQTVTLNVAGRLSGLLLHDMTAGEAEVAAGNGRITMILPPYGSKVLLEQLHGAGKTCGVLLHPTSLPSLYGIGDFGSEAAEFIDFLAEAGQKLWQILPINPPGSGDSPYMALSAFAGNPLLISPELLVRDGLLTAQVVATAAAALDQAAVNSGQVDFPVAKAFKDKLFRQAFERFQAKPEPADYDKFCRENNLWLPDYALFMALSAYHNDLPWNKWEQPLIDRKPEVLAAWRITLADEIKYYSFLQYQFFRQWRTVKQYAHKRGIKIIGDLPIFVAHNSSDVWANQRLFKLDENGNPIAVAGVPPDYFSETGQLWGNPLYRWKAMAADDYLWWRERFACLLSQVDIVRVDHFRGFESYWEIPAGELTAVNGQWKKGPGMRFFQIVERYLGRLPIIAEDLGIITDEVVKLKQTLAFPGMKVLHFCFGSVAGGQVPPIGIERDSVAYTGTHDNNTTVGWYQEDLADSPAEKECVDAYLGADAGDSAEELCWRLIALAYESKAATVIVPMQDLLALGSSSRMNRPGTMGGGNWAWRLNPGFCAQATAERLKQLVEKNRR